MGSEAIGEGLRDGNLATTGKKGEEMDNDREITMTAR